MTKSNEISYYEIKKIPNSKNKQFDSIYMSTLNPLKPNTNVNEETNNSYFLKYELSENDESISIIHGKNETSKLKKYKINIEYSQQNIESFKKEFINIQKSNNDNAAHNFIYLCSKWNLDTINSIVSGFKINNDLIIINFLIDTLDSEPMTEPIEIINIQYKDLIKISKYSNILKKTNLNILSNDKKPAISIDIEDYTWKIQQKSSNINELQNIIFQQILKYNNTKIFKKISNFDALLISLIKRASFNITPEETSTKNLKNKPEYEIQQVSINNIELTPSKSNLIEFISNLNGEYLPPWSDNYNYRVIGNYIHYKNTYFTMFYENEITKIFIF